MNPFFATDGYKTGHVFQYPEGTITVYNNLTPRSNKHAPKGCDEIVVFGSQMTMMIIDEMFEKYFFKIHLRKGFLTDNLPISEETKLFINNLKQTVCQEIKNEYSIYLNTEYDVSHIEALWDLGYLPIEVKSLPEGTLCPIGVPVMTIKNTLPEFFWLPNFLETLISNIIWKPMTSATIAYRYKRNLLEWAKRTDEENLEFVEFQGHDFSMRGMDGISSAVRSGLGHTTSFLGSDSLPVIHGARKYYGETDFVVGSVNATEHSVMCAGTKDDEIGTFRYLMKQFPTGILSIVSDTWDLWKVLTEYLPQLKEEILARDGKIVIRPDSGDPVDIICGTGLQESNHGGQPDFDWTNSYNQKLLPSEKGVIELLWDTFGGTINDQGYKVLNPHIGAIYGDSITIDRAEEICKRLEAKGFASTNIVLGIGSYTYQFNTRDTFGFAVKATYVEVNGESREIFKDPITDDGTKKSAKGLLRVEEVTKGNTKEKTYVLFDQVDWKGEQQGALQTIFKDGEFYNKITLTEIRNKLKQTL